MLVRGLAQKCNIFAGNVAFGCIPLHFTCSCGGRPRVYLVFKERVEEILLSSDYSITAPYGGHEINRASTIRVDLAHFANAHGGFTGNYAFRKSLAILGCDLYYRVSG